MTAVVPYTAASERKKPTHAELNPRRDAELRRLSLRAAEIGNAAAAIGLPPTLEIGYFRGYKAKVFGPPKRIMDAIHYGWTVAYSLPNLEDGTRYIAGITEINGFGPDVASDWRLAAMQVMPEDIRPDHRISVPVGSYDERNERPYGGLSNEAMYRTSKADVALGSLSLVAVEAGLEAFYAQVMSGNPS